MKNNKDFETFEESKKVSELFTFAEKENEKQFLSEDFVFKFEDNTQQAGADLNVNQSGIEDNDNSKELNEAKKEEELDKDKLKQEETSQASSSSTSASSASSSASATASTGGVVSTVAATVTTAAVLVVGGGIAIYGQTIDKPSICQFNEVVAVENNINFTLSLGNDQIKIDNGEENTECDIIVELTCPSMSDFRDEFPVSSFGKVSGAFSNLKYDTEYLLNVSQHVMMGADYEYLLDIPYSIKTPQEVVEPTEPDKPTIENGIKFYKEIDPSLSYTYYYEVSYDGDLSSYGDLYVGLFYDYSDVEQDSDMLGEMIYETIYNPDATGKQRLEYHDCLDEVYSEYVIALYGYDSTQDQGQTVILKEHFKFADDVEIFNTEITDNHVYLGHENVQGNTDNYYSAYVAYEGEYLNATDISVYFSDPNEEDFMQEGYYGYFTMRELNNREDVELILGNNYPGLVDVKVTVTGNYIAEGSPTTESVVLFSQITNLGSLFGAYQPQLEDPLENFKVLNSSFNSYLTLNLNSLLIDYGFFWSDFTITFTSMDGGDTFTSSLVDLSRTANTKYCPNIPLRSSDGEEEYLHTDDETGYKLQIEATSTYPFNAGRVLVYENNEVFPYQFEQDRVEGYLSLYFERLNTDTYLYAQLNNYSNLSYTYDTFMAEFINVRDQNENFEITLNTSSEEATYIDKLRDEVGNNTYIVIVYACTINGDDIEKVDVFTEEIDFNYVEERV